MKKLSLFLLVLMLIVPLSAQDENTTQDPPTHPLEVVLRHIPSVESTRQNLLSYLDVEATYGVLDWLEQDEEHAYTHDSFFEAFPNGFQFANRWAYIPNELANIRFAINPAVGVPSLDIFQIGQIASFGVLPDAGTLIRGEIDIEALISDYRALNIYDIDQANTTYYVRNRAEIQPNQHPQNFFDPMMKRAIPLVIDIGADVALIAGALSETFYERLTTTFEHSDSSIWHEPYYQLTAQALIDWEATHQAQIIQAVWFPNAEMLKRSVNLRNADDILALPQLLQSSNPENPMPSWADGYRELTDFEVPVLIADLQADEQQVFVLIVPFDHVGNAEFSAQALVERLQTYNNQARILTDVPFAELYQGTISHTIYQDANGEQGAAVIAMHYTAPPLEADGNAIYQADLYHVIYTSITERLFYLLWDVTLP